MAAHTVQEGHCAGRGELSIKEKVNILHVVFVYGVPGMCWDSFQMRAWNNLWQPAGQLLHGILQYEEAFLFERVPNTNIRPEGVEYLFDFLKKI